MIVTMLRLPIRCCQMLLMLHSVEEGYKFTGEKKTLWSYCLFGKILCCRMLPTQLDRVVKASILPIEAYLTLFHKVSEALLQSYLKFSASQLEKIYQQAWFMIWAPSPRSRHTKLCLWQNLERICSRTVHWSLSITRLGSQKTISSAGSSEPETAC